jgi:hypothetical protein
MSKTIVASVIALTMGIGGLSAAGQVGGAVDATKQAGQATKSAAKTAGNTTKKAHSAKTQKSANAACTKRGGGAK